MVQQYELFRIKEDEDIETMFSRFQVMVFGLQVMNKSYTTFDHVKKILRSLPAKYRPKVTAIQEAKDLNKISLQSHDMELIGDEPTKNFKFLSLRFVGQSAKSPQVWKPEEVVYT